MNHPERDFERRCVAEARRQGWTCWKNENNGLKGIPDYSMLHHDGRFLLVEFKRPDGKGRLSAEQRTWLSRFPVTCHVIASYEEFRTLLGAETENGV